MQAIQNISVGIRIEQGATLYSINSGAICCKENTIVTAGVTAPGVLPPALTGHPSVSLVRKLPAKKQSRISILSYALSVHGYPISTLKFAEPGFWKYRVQFMLSPTRSAQ
jgi:hypothetical protein